MRHAVSGKKLGRDTNARKALAMNLASSLIVEGHIKTTLAKAKFVRSFAEKLITDAKKNTLSNKRSLAPRLTKQAFIRLITQVGPGFESRSGGYTKIIKLAPRRGDRAPMAKIEILEWDKTKEIFLENALKPEGKKKISKNQNENKEKTNKKDEKIKGK